MKEKSVHILVLGASGMLGQAILRYFNHEHHFEVVGTIRSLTVPESFPANIRNNILTGVEVDNIDGLLSLFAKTRPNVVINAVGVIKHLSEANDPLVAIPVNALLPHRLARICALVGARLIHLSTDCVFSGSTGMYKESDFPDAKDLYGRSKFLGEVDYPNAITLRTSFISPEADSAEPLQLVGWFLAQKDRTKGFRRAIYSGLPTVEIARIIKDFVLPNPDMHGLYHVSADPISKFELLKLIAMTYGKNIEIECDDSLVIDRSLDSMLFRKKTGFSPRSWPELIKVMHEFG